MSDRTTDDGVSTERLYYTDAYLTRFDARVTARADEGRRVYLTRSAFYPTSGGQPNDVGTLNGVAVVDVVDEGDRVAHLLAAALDADAVSGEVDWARRLDHMQQHTGQHLLSALFDDAFGYKTVSVHFGPDYATLDLSVESVPAAQLREVERRANEIVAENRPVTVGFEDAATASGLRKPSEREGTLRIVTIEGIDRNACGGTHVRRTGEIGAILLRRQEKVRRAARIDFLCGGRAVRRARADFETLTAMAQGLSCAIDELPALVTSQLESLKGMDNERRKMEGELSAYRARERWEATVPDESGVRRLVERRATGRADDARSFAMAFCALPRAVYVGTVDEPPSLLVAASDDSGVDAGRTLKEALAAVGGRGGGSPRLAQGTVPTPDALAAVLAAFGVSL